MYNKLKHNSEYWGAERLRGVYELNPFNLIRIIPSEGVFYYLVEYLFNWN